MVQRIRENAKEYELVRLYLQDSICSQQKN